MPRVTQRPDGYPRLAGLTARTSVPVHRLGKKPRLQASGTWQGHFYIVSNSPSGHSPARKWETRHQILTRGSHRDQASAMPQTPEQPIMDACDH